MRRGWRGGGARFGFSGRGSPGGGGAGRVRLLGRRILGGRRPRPRRGRPRSGGRNSRGRVRGPGRKGPGGAGRGFFLGGGGIAFETPTKVGEMVESGTRFSLSDSPKADWLEWSPAIDLSAR